MWVRLNEGKQSFKLFTQCTEFWALFTTIISYIHFSIGHQINILKYDKTQLLNMLTSWV